MHSIGIKELGRKPPERPILESISISPLQPPKKETSKLNLQDSTEHIRRIWWMKRVCK